MSEFPDWFRKIVDEETISNESDTRRAIRNAERRISSHEDYQTLLNRLLTTALEAEVGRRRQLINRTIRYKATTNPNLPEVKNLSPVLNAVCKSVYNYCIGGTTLGELQGKDLKRLAMTEHKTAKTHSFHRDLLLWLSEVVGEFQTVKEAVTEQQLAQEFRRRYREATGLEYDAAG